MTGVQTFPYAKAEVATTNVAFTMGMADAVLITTTISVSGLTLTTATGDVTIGLQPLGTIIPIACTKAVFGGGGVCALKFN